MIETYGINARGTVWLGLDPGVTTGWALIDKGGKLVGHGELVEENLDDGLDQIIRGCHRAQRKVKVVIEKMPPGEVGRLSDRLAAVRAVVDDLVGAVYELPVVRVSPGEWKNSRVAKIVRWTEKFSSQHARDAATMALYAMDKEKRNASRSD
jgi:predicted RNase H-like nuclease (RuvC/YqgF family)